MKRCKDCRHQNSLEIDGYTACPFMKICQNNDRHMYQRKRWKLWAPKLIIILALLRCGCSSKSLHERVWDKDGNLIKRVDVTVRACLTDTKAKNIVAITEDKFLFVGDLSQAPDPASVKAVFSAIAEAMMPWWKAVKP